jgi:transposase-like protein
MRRRFTGAQVARAIRWTGGRWDVASPLRARPRDAMLQERGVLVAPSTSTRWGLRDSPRLEAALPRRPRPVWRRGRLDDTDRRLRGPWRSRERAVAKAGHPRACRLPEPREARAATRVLAKAIRRHGVPEQSTREGSAAQAAARRTDPPVYGTLLGRRRVPSLHPVLDQDHRAVTWVTRSRRGVHSCGAAPCPLPGLARMPRLRHEPLEDGAEQGLTPAQPCDAPAAASAPPQGSPVPSPKIATHPDCTRYQRQHRARARRTADNPAALTLSTVRMAADPQPTTLVTDTNEYDRVITGHPLPPCCRPSEGLNAGRLCLCRIKGLCDTWAKATKGI